VPADPSETGLRLSAQRQAESSVPVTVGGDDAQSLPFPDHRFDAALPTWTMCGYRMLPLLCARWRGCSSRAAGLLAASELTVAAMDN